MARTDPTDNGGLFVGRRPGTAPVKYRSLPEKGSERRRRIDGLLAALLLIAMVFVCLLFFGPVPAAWLWVASRVQYAFGTISLAILIAFVGMLGTLMLGLLLLRRLDLAWILVRRAAGVDQRDGVMSRVFAYSAAIAAVLFFGWLILFAGLGPTIGPAH